VGTIPVPPTITAGQVLTAAQVNQIIAVPSFWANPPQCYAYNSTATTCATSTYTPLPLQSEVFDVVQSGDSPSHDNTTANTRIYFRTAGKYQISGQVNFVVNATGSRQVDVRLNAAGSPAGGTRVNFSSQVALSGVATSVPLPVVPIVAAVGDYIEMFGWQNSGGNLDTLPGSALTFLTARLISS
jgi:hypothetical protein